MITTKSKREIELMEIAGRICYDAVEEIRKAIRPGVTTAYLDKIAHDAIIAAGATPSFLGFEGYPASICTSVNEQLVHGIPSHDVILKNGDIITIDIGAIYKGYQGDHAWTFPVGTISEEAQKLLDVTKTSLFKGLDVIHAGATIGDIGAAIEEYVEAAGYSLPVEYTGHGIGTEMHEDPAVPNVGVRGRGVVLRKGMTIAVEPMVHVGGPQTKTLKDGWTVISKDHSLTAHFEHTVLVLDDGVQILTQSKEGCQH